MNKSQEKVYLDYASATPVSQEVLSAMKPFWSDVFGNPQSRHSYGRKAQKAVNQARKQIANTLSVQESELVFTSGATEANALAMIGRWRAENRGGNILTTTTAHTSQRSTTNIDGLQVTSIKVNDSGRLTKKNLRSQISKDTVQVSVPYVNSEIGTIQPTQKVREVIADTNSNISLHLDASQAGLYLSVRPEDMNADMVTVNSPKLYGPKGVGLLWVKSGTAMAGMLPTTESTVIDDYQSLRPGTPPVPLIIGFAEALSQAQSAHKARAKEVSAVRDFAINELQNEFPDLIINGSLQNRVANNVNFSLPDTDHDYLVTKLDTAGIVVSASTACQSDQDGSVVIKALPGDNNAGVRVTLGKDTTQGSVKRFISALKQTV
jgi:cysteine desulfurase